MARTRKALPQKLDVAHLVSAGMLTSVCPRALIDQVLANAGKSVMYYVMALALWREAPLEEVLRVD